MAVVLDEIRKAAERVAASHGLCLVDIEFLGGAKERILRISIEKATVGRAQLPAASAENSGHEGAGRLLRRSAEGGLGDGQLGVPGNGPSPSGWDQLSGVTHEDCAAFSRDFGTLLDVEDLVPGAAYTLEVSSPGLDRKLIRPEDYDRFAGCLIKVRTFEPIRNNRHWQGRLKAGSTSALESGQIVLDLSATQQNSKTRKTGVSTIEIALGNIERANLVPEV